MVRVYFASRRSCAQSINQASKRPINQAINQSMESSKRPINQAINQSMESSKRLINQAINQSINEVKQATDQSSNLNLFLPGSWSQIHNFMRMAQPDIGHGHFHVHNLFMWSMAVIYLFAFASLYHQLPGLYGDHGVLPVARDITKTPSLG
jgi:hypothetical protein